MFIELLWSIIELYVVILIEKYKVFFSNEDSIMLFFKRITMFYSLQFSFKLYMKYLCIALQQNLRPISKEMNRLYTILSYYFNRSIK